MAEKLAGKVAIVTGASSGIGRALSRLLVAGGARVAMAARSGDRLRGLEAELGAAAAAVVVDLTDPASVERMVGAARERFGPIDILAANAGLFTTGEAVEENPDDWDALLSVNVNSVFRAVHAVLPEMIERGGGDIVVTSSIAGHRMMQMEPVYSAMVEDLKAGSFGTKRYKIQLADNSVSLLKTGHIPGAQWDAAMALRDKIIAGSVKVDLITDAQAVRALMTSVEAKAE